MKNRCLALSILLALALPPTSRPASADEGDADFSRIKSIDLSDDKPAAPNAADSSPNHIALMLNLNKVKHGTLGQVILYQFSKRMRLEFEADGLPKGEYVLAVGKKCAPARLGASWTTLHRFQSTSAHIQTEKSLPKASLREPKPGNILLHGKYLALFRVKPATQVDCKIIE